MPRLFGTDGVRGVANQELTPDLALALGRAAGRVLSAPGRDVIVGRDTRISGPMLEAALVAGVCSAGVNACLAGILPSPAVSFLTTDEHADAGGMISASHNPVADNGIKFFSAEGLKLTSDLEDAIEERMHDPETAPPVSASEVGTSYALADGAERYEKHLLSALDVSLEGLEIVLDCAYGAAWDIGPRVFRDAGATVIALHDAPDGSRINVDCGSTSMGVVARTVREQGADMGLAVDGDADRVLAVDERGEVVDGDRILAITALHLAARGELDGNLIVSSVMSNAGMTRALSERGIEVVQAPVGDKYVVEMMLDRGAVLGGEQSGHVIFGRHGKTGDGLLTGLQLAGAVVSSGGLHDLAHVYEPFPQVLINVPVQSRQALEGADEVWEETADIESGFAGEGRVLLRASGTEPVVRVMVEAPKESDARAAAERLAESVRRHLG